MWKKTVIELTQSEVLQIGIAHSINMDFEHDKTSKTGTGIRPVFNGFYDEKRQKIDKRVVEERIMHHLREKRIINDKKWRLKWLPDHYWSTANEDGDRYSIYELTAEVYKRDYIVTKEEKKSCIS